MKLAIFHDYIGAIGGSEKLVLDVMGGCDNPDVDENSVKKMGSRMCFGRTYWLLRVKKQVFLI